MARHRMKTRSYNRALQYAERVVRALAESGSNRQGADAYTIVSLASLELGELNRAAEAATKALTLLETAGRSARPELLLALGKISFARGDYVNAVNYFERAARSAREKRAEFELISAYLGLCQCYIPLRQHDRLVSCAALCVELSRAFSNMSGLAVSLMTQAGAYLVSGDKENASVAYEEAMKIGQNFSGPQREAFLQGAATWSILLGRTPDGTHGPEVWDVLMQDAPSATELVFLLTQKARALAIDGQLETAESQLDVAIARARELQAQPLLRVALITLAEVQRCRKRYAAVENTLREAIDINDRIREMPGGADDVKRALTEGLYEYGLLQEALAAQNKPDEVIEIAERGRARAFADLIEQRLGTRQPSEPAISAEELSQYAAAARATIIEFSEIVNFQGMLSLSTVDIEIFLSVVGSGFPIELRRVLIGSRDLAQDNNWTPPLPSGASSTDFRNLTFPSDRGDFNEYLASLSSDLIQPVVDLLPGSPAESLIFVPDRLLLSVPFAALPHPLGGTVVDHHPVIVAPSIQVLAKIRKRSQLRPRSSAGALVVGNPDGSLLHAEQEAIEIAEMLGTSPLIGASADKARVLEEMPRHRILHFATHGGLGDINRNGLPGAIQLTSPQNGPVWLRSDEIMNLGLNADLVVLSACSTARGKETADGIIGLSRTLLGAGAQTVLVSLWPVPDYPTRVLMNAFYREYLKTGDKAQALRLGMLAARTVDPDPASWGAFILIGERY